ncbi:zinc-binding oxidoreductase [Moniliophthora roreri]|nr:zinc-binding oxidoreductase [Moniliophthora roreri]
MDPDSSSKDGETGIVPLGRANYGVASGLKPSLFRARKRTSDLATTFSECLQDLSCCFIF